MSWNEIKDAAMLVLMFLAFGVPALGIAVRLALRPIVDSILRLRESFGPQPQAGVNDRMARLEQEVQLLHATVRQLSETTSFDRELQGNSGIATSLPGSVGKPPRA